MKIIFEKQSLSRGFDGLSKIKEDLLNRSYPREELYQILLKYNQEIGNDGLALSQIERIKNSQSVCIFTGQQLGLMGGPAYTILKALSCLLMARELDAIPIFWLASEDHDLAEISHTYLLDGFGNLEKYALSFPKDGRSVQDLEFTEKNLEVIEQFLKVVDIPKSSLFAVGGSYALAMANFLATQFAGTGLVFIEPRCLRQLSVSFFEREIEEWETILQTLRGTTRRLEEAGQTTVLPFKDGINLFLKENVSRRKLRWEGGLFTTGTKNYGTLELLRIARNEPERFSTNVASRPVLQSKLFPTLAYLAGPAELSYFRQLDDYFAFHDVPKPMIVPRLSATMIPKDAGTFLKKCALEPWKAVPHHWIELMPAVQESLHTLSSGWNQMAQEHFGGDVNSEALSRFIRLSLRKIQRKVCRARLHQQEVPPYALHYLRNLMHPHGKLQERVLNWFGFQAKSQENLLTAFLQQAKWQSPEHLYCYL